MSEPLEALLASARVFRARANRERAHGPVLATGWPVLDARLPGAGWPLGTLVELLLPVEGVGELSLLLPALRGLAPGSAAHVPAAGAADVADVAGTAVRTGSDPAVRTVPDAPSAGAAARADPGGDARRWLAWIGPPHAPYPPALAQGGVAPERLLIVEVASAQDRLWAMEQALRSGSCAAVLGWLDAVDDRWLRRLKLAATGRVLAVLFRHHRRREQPSAATLRLVLEPTPRGLDVLVLKCRRSGPERIHDVLRT